MDEQIAILQAILKATPHAIGVYRILYQENGLVEDFEVLFFNSLMLTVSGFSADQVVGKRYGALFPVAHQNGVFSRLKEVAEKNVTADFELSYGAEGSSRWHRFIVVKQQDLLVVTMEDITERKKADLELKESKELLQGIMDAPNVGISVFKTIRNENGEIENFRFEYVNRRTREAFGSIDSIGTLITDYGSDGYEQMDYFKEVIETGKRNTYIRKAESGIVVGWFLLSNASLGNDRLVQVWEDVTEIKKTEQTIIQLKDELAQKAKDKYFSLFNAINEGFGIGDVIFDENGNGVDLRWSDLNPQFEKLTGLSREEMLSGKTVRELMPGMELKWFEIIGNVVLTRQPVRFESFAAPLNRWYDCYAFPIDDPNLNYVAILFQDVTERKRTDEALRESQARLAADLEGMKQLYELHTKLSAEINLKIAIEEILFVGANVLGTHRGCVQLANEDGAYLEMFAFKGFEVNSLFVQHFQYGKSNYVFDSGKQEFCRLIINDFENFIPLRNTEDLAVILSEGVRASLSVPLVSRKGKLLGVLSHQFSAPYQPTNEQLRMIDMLVWTAADFVERHQTNNALRESEQRFRTLIDAIPQIIWSKDAAGNAVYFNNRWYEYTGLSFEESCHHGWKGIVHPDDAQVSMQLWNDALVNKSIFDTEFRLRRSDGKYRWHIGRIMPLFDNDGNIEGWIASATDIDELKTLQKQKDDFLGIASHELKTPVTSIKVYAEIIQEKFEQANDAENERLMQNLNDQLDRLTGLIRDLLDTSKIEEGQLELVKESFDINHLLEQQVEEIQRVSNRHIINLINGPVVRVFADRERIGQVITNLLSNAIKYSQPGTTITVQSQATENGIKVSVQDEGVGIPALHLNKIFDRFYRISNETLDTYPGMGLGLFISSKIILRHGGVMDVESEEGQGSVFSFILPNNQDMHL